MLFQETFNKDGTKTGGKGDGLFDPNGHQARSLDPKAIKKALKNPGKKKPYVKLGIPNGHRSGERLEDFEHDHPYQTTSKKITRHLMRLGLSSATRKDVADLEKTHSGTTVWKISTSPGQKKTTYEKLNGYEALTLRAKRAVARRAVAATLAVGAPVALLGMTDTTPGQFIDNPIAAFSGAGQGSQIGTSSGVAVTGKKTKTIKFSTIDVTCTGGEGVATITKKDATGDYPALDAMQRKFGDTALSGFAYNDPTIADELLTAISENKTLGGGEPLPDAVGAVVPVPLNCGPKA